MVKGQLRNAENARIICEGLASGLSLRKVCEGLGCEKFAVSRWVAADPEFSAQYARAVEQGHEARIGEIIDIADDLEIAPEHKKIMIDVRKWNAVKCLPKVYGDRLAVDITKIAEEFEGADSAALAKIAGVELPNNRNESA